MHADGEALQPVPAAVLRAAQGPERLQEGAIATARKFLGIVYRTLKHGWVFSDFPNFVLAEQ